MDDTEIEILRLPVSIGHLRSMAAASFGDLVKAVVDVERGVMAVGGGMHADEEAALLDLGSRQPDLWGINLYPDLFGSPGFVEFDSMINLRPALGNRSRSVEDAGLRERIVHVLEALVTGG